MSARVLFFLPISYLFIILLLNLYECVNDVNRKGFWDIDEKIQENVWWNVCWIFFLEKIMFLRKKKIFFLSFYWYGLFYLDSTFKFSSFRTTITPKNAVIWFQFVSDVLIMAINENDWEMKNTLIIFNYLNLKQPLLRLHLYYYIILSIDIITVNK